MLRADTYRIAYYFVGYDSSSSFSSSSPIRIRVDLYTAVLHDCDGRRHNFVPMTTATPARSVEGYSRKGGISRSDRINK